MNQNIPTFGITIRIRINFARPREVLLRAALVRAGLRLIFSAVGQAWG
jgi:hypothetical protein